MSTATLELPKIASVIRSDTSRCALTLLSHVLVWGALDVAYVHILQAVSMTHYHAAAPLHCAFRYVYSPCSRQTAAAVAVVAAAAAVVRLPL